MTVILLTIHILSEGNQESNNSVLTLSDRKSEKETAELQEIWGTPAVTFNDILQFELKIGYGINL